MQVQVQVQMQVQVLSRNDSLRLVTSRNEFDRLFYFVTKRIGIGIGNVQV